jgi:hypothetical protein
MSRGATTLEDEEFFDRSGVVEECHKVGLKHITEGSVIRATYYGKRPLKSTRVGNRIYYSRSAIGAWIASGARGR